ncbi:MarR family winged helix-turn-helix transcriptional regulator [Nocardia thailandica]
MTVLSSVKMAGMPAPAQDLPYLLLAAATEVTDAVHAGVQAAGFTDVRPTHGFVFVRLAPAGATIGEIADHLGVTKQAASQLVDELLRKGYVARGPHPADARAKLVTLTERGWACTRAADAAAAAWLRRAGERVGAGTLAEVRDALAGLVTPGRIRPAAW